MIHSVAGAIIKPHFTFKNFEKIGVKNQNLNSLWIIVHLQNAVTKHVCGKQHCVYAQRVERKNDQY